MSKTDLLEPKNGDFIAYIEQLQQHTLDSLQVTNAHRIAHDEEKRVSLRHFASDLSTAPATSSSNPEPSTQSMRRSSEKHQNHSSVAEEFSTNTPPTNRKNQQSPAFAVANFLVFAGFFIIIFGINTDLEDIAGSGFFLMMLGLMLMRALRRHRH